MKPQQRKYQHRKGSDKIRLNRYIASSGVCSRREADDLISKGVVTVNNRKVTELGTQVSNKDEVRVKGKIVQNQKKVYILLNKPKDTLTTTHDPEKRQTVMNLIEGATNERVYPVGRLDRNTTGVLLLTNDGDLAAKLTHPSYGMRKIYHVGLNQPLTEKHFEQLLKGIELDDGLMKVDSISWISNESRKEIGIGLHSGKNRIVRRLFEHLGYQVTKLDRVYFAGLTKKKISRGRWRHLNPREVTWLKMGKHGT